MSIRPYYERGGVVIYHASCAELCAELPEASVDMIMTDPPYPREYLDCYRDLALGARRACKPGAFVYAYVGADSLPDVVAGEQNRTTTCPVAHFIDTVHWWPVVVSLQSGDVAWVRELWCKETEVAMLSPVLLDFVKRVDRSRARRLTARHCLRLLDQAEREVNG